jgi:hypothetical protein
MKAWGCPFAMLHQAGIAYINYTLEEMLYMKRQGFYHRSGAEWEKRPGQRKRPHPASTQPLSVREGYLAPESW